MAAHRAILLAPGASPLVTARAPGQDENLPPVDERLVAPESRFEAVDGVLIETMGANEPHAVANGELIFALRAATKAGYRCAVDMLMRADRFSDVAPDASVFPEERDEAGGRKLEEIVFEVRDTQALSDITRKAELLTERGVRRFFCLEVASRRVREWKNGDWDVLALDSVIDDPVFASPLPVAALVNAAEADNSAARALLAKGNPVLEQAIQEGRREGRQEGRQEALVGLVQQRLRRSLTADERRELLARFARLGAERLNDVILQRGAEELTAWLSDPSAT